MQTCSAPRKNIRGFTYLGLLIAVAILALGTTASLRLGALSQRRNAEQELLFVGAQYRNAFQSYYMMTPAGRQQYPTTLQDLIKDPRFPQTVRHLRKIYSDPITTKADWNLIAAPAGGIMGVSSRSKDQPIKIGNFAERDRAFEGKTKYSEWVFSYVPAGGLFPAPGRASELPPR